MYLSQVRNIKKSVDMISAKLDMDYSYCTKILKRMLAKDWIFQHKYKNKAFYDLHEEAPIENAKAVLMPEIIQNIISAAEQQKLESVAETANKVKEQ